VLVDGLSDRDLAMRLDAAVHWQGQSSTSTGSAMRAAMRSECSPLRGPPANPRSFHSPSRSLFGSACFVVTLPTRRDARRRHRRIEAPRQRAEPRRPASDRALTALAAGDLELAVDAARESTDLTRDTDAGLIPAATALALAAALVEPAGAGLADAVELVVRRCGDAALPNLPGGSFHAKWLKLVTRCSQAFGRRADAERAAARAQAVLAPMEGLRMATAMADRAAAAAFETPAASPYRTQGGSPWGRSTNRR
jgi:hypothetical protein